MLLVVVVAHWAALFWVAAHWVPLLGIDPEKTIIQRHAQYTPVFVAAQLTIARAWRQPKCPSAEEQIKKMWCVHCVCVCVCVCVYMFVCIYTHTHNGILAIKRMKLGHL